MPTKSVAFAWDPAEHLLSVEDMVADLAAVLETAGRVLVAAALGDIARAKAG